MIKSKKSGRIPSVDDFSETKLDPIENKSFTFIVLTHNDAQTIEKNYESILTQNYASFNVIYIDQGSSDGTVELLKKKAALHNNVQVFKCLEGHEAYETYYKTVLKCLDNQVIVHLYGTDWLIHNEVLSLLSQSYSHPDVWLSYGQYLDYWNYQKGVLDPKPKKNLCKKRVQRAPWVTAPLKTYYAGLLKKLHIETGFFLSIEDENALLNPIVELGKAHVRFIPDILFVHNEKSENYKEGRRLAFIAEKFKEPIEKSFCEPLVDLTIFSENTPENLRECLDSSQAFLKGINTTHVIYTCSEETYGAYQMLKKTYPDAHFIRGLEYGEITFKEAVMQALAEGNQASPYMILSTDQVRVHTPVILSSCVEAMRKTGAYGFYLHLGKERKSWAGKGVYLWNIRHKERSFKEPDALKMGLYRRLELERDLRELMFSSTEGLINAWGIQAPCYQLGLSFEEPKVL